MGAVYAKCCKNKSYGFDNNDSSTPQSQLHNSGLPSQTTFDLEDPNQISSVQNAIKFGNENNLKVFDTHYAWTFRDCGNKKQKW